MVDLRGKLPTRAGARPYYTRPLDAITGVTIHYTASTPDGTPAIIAAYQTGPNGHLDFPAVAYHFLIDRAGIVYQCHDLETRCWHNGAVVDGIARNLSHVGICWIGNHTPTQAQVRGMQAAVEWSEGFLGKSLQVEGHRDSDRTSCPGPTWEAWRSAFR